MKSHFMIIGHFGTSHRPTGALKRISETPDGNAALEAQPAVQLGEAGQARLLLSLKMALKCSDLSHTFADLPVHLKWVNKLEEEVGLAWQPIPMQHRRGEASMYDSHPLDLFEFGVDMFSVATVFYHHSLPPLSRSHILSFYHSSLFRVTASGDWVSPSPLCLTDRSRASPRARLASSTSSVRGELASWFHYRCYMIVAAVSPT